MADGDANENSELFISLQNFRKVNHLDAKLPKSGLKGPFQFIFDFVTSAEIGPIFYKCH